MLLQPKLIKPDEKWDKTLSRGRGDLSFVEIQRFCGICPNTFETDCSLSKICEKIIFARLYDFLMDIGFLHPFQSGFRPGHSTTSQLTYIIHQIYECLENGKEVRAVFLDISKAFDRVWHEGLISKLKYLGVSGPLLTWLQSYLS